MTYLNDDSLQICEIGSSELNAKTNVLTAQCKGAAFETDDATAEEYSGCDVFGQLGVTARPNAKTDAGYAEAIVDVVRNKVIAARDTRTASVVGNLQPGDTCLHSTGDNQNARIFCKEYSSTIAAMVKDSDGNDMGIVVDGENKKVVLLASGSGVIEVSEDGIKIGHTSGFITITSDGIQVVGSKVSLGPSGQEPLITGSQLQAILSASLGTLSSDPTGATAVSTANSAIAALGSTSGTFGS